MKSQDKGRSSIRVCLVVQNRLLRETMTRLFHKKSGIMVVANEFSAESSGQSREVHCDILLMDSLKAECAKDLEESQAPHGNTPKALFFGMDDDPNCFLGAIRKGAVRRVAQGEAVCPPKLFTCCLSMLRAMRRHFANASKEPAE